MAFTSDTAKAAAAQRHAPKKGDDAGDDKRGRRDDDESESGSTWPWIVGLVLGLVGLVGIGWAVLRARAKKSDVPAAAEPPANGGPRAVPDAPRASA